MKLNFRNLTTFSLMSLVVDPDYPEVSMLFERMM